MKTFWLVFVLTISGFVLALTSAAAEVSSRKKDLARQTVHEIENKANEIIVKEEKPLLWRLVLAQNHDGETPFHVAAKNGNRNMIDIMVPFVVRHPGLLKAMLESKNNHGKTGLQLAEEAGHAAVVSKIRNLMKSDHYKN